MPRASRRTAAADDLSAERGAGSGGPLRLWQLALACLAGNLALHSLPALPGPLLVLALAGTAGGMLALFGLRLTALPAIALIAFCWTAFAAGQGLALRWPPGADGQDVMLAGWIDSAPTQDAGRTVFSLRVTAAAIDQPPRRVRLSWYDPAPELVAGQGLNILARLRTPRGLSNPGGFDYERWLFLEAYDATGYVREGASDDGVGFSVARSLLWLRSRLAQQLAERIEDADAAALIVALSLGDRNRFDDRHWRVLQRTGTSHLVAVSGLHIGLIAALAYVVVLRVALYLPYGLARHAHTLAALCCILPASLYAALAGFGLPTRRALVMVLVAQAVILWRRGWPASTGLSLALILVLALDPLASLTASFWLSFGAVAVLFVAIDNRRRPHAGTSRLLSWLREFWRMQWLLTLGLAPLVIGFFGLVSPASMVVNLIAIPLFSLILVPLSLLVSLLAMLSVSAAGLFTLVGLLAGWAWRGLELAAALPFAAFEVPGSSPLRLGLALFAILLALPRHGLPGRRLALLALLPLFAGTRMAFAPGEARVTVLDVGHGLAVVIETASHRLLYDAGPLYRSGFDAGAEIVGPALRALSAEPLDLLLLSHGDSDHAGGAGAILARYPDAAVLAGPDIDWPGAGTCVAGQAWVWDDVRFEVLHPTLDFGFEGNESSCVLRVVTSGGVLLLTGDIERRAESRLVADARLAADVVIVPHHGSLTSSSTAFVNAVGPGLAIVSAGFNNRWNFPRPDVRRRWELAGATMLVTGDTGAIDLSFRSGSIAYGASRATWQRYWQAKRDVVSGAIGVAAL